MPILRENQSLDVQVSNEVSTSRPAVPPIISAAVKKCFCSKQLEVIENFFTSIIYKQMFLENFTITNVLNRRGDNLRR